MFLFQQNDIKVFVETGTFFGDTIDFLKDHFSKLYTIELQEDLYLKAKERFEGNNNVEVIFGDSSTVLKELVLKLKGKTLFWLDGHYSSEFFVGSTFVKTAKGDKNTPIIEELTEILKNGLNDNIILIDDARCFTGKNDYPSKKELLEFLKKYGILKKQIKIKKDIIRITTI
jgi:hypothetical protein